MHVPLLAGPRRRTRRVLSAAVLPAAVAACALPAGAHAGDVFVSNTGQLSYIDASNRENNDVLLRVEGNEIVITDTARITSSSLACQVVNPNRAECPANVNVTVNTLGGDDKVEYRLPNAGFVFLGEGVDTVFGGRRQSSGQSINPVTYNGGAGHDKISYAGADRGVSLTPEDNLANDGRPGGIDRENVDTTFEEFIGSNFNDAPLFGTAHTDLMDGGPGNDQIAGGGGNDVFLPTPGDGTDDYHGGPDFDSILYFRYSTPVNVSLDNVANDGAAGERDQVRSNVENITGGSAGDTLRSFGAFSILDGRGGVDTLIGDGGPDTLIGGPEVDRLDAGAGNDVIDSRDGEAENVDCGPGDGDTLIRDFDGFVGCEDVKVGVLRLAPKTITATPGKAARVRLSWRHPESWRKLRSIELRLYRDGAPVGKVTILPRAQRITADGAVKLVRTASRLSRKGKTVTAHLAVRLGDNLAGQTLTAEVEATNQRGVRQLDRDAGTIRVAG